LICHPTSSAGLEEACLSGPTRRPQTAADGPQKGHGTKSAAVREQAILALLSERTIERAVEQANVGVRTLRRWLTEDPEFQADYAAARKATFEAGMSRMHALTSRAVNPLEDLLEAKDHPTVRLGAARTLVEIGMHQHDADTIMRKLEEIEAAQQRRR